MNKRETNRSSGGYTMVEVLVAATILALMLGAVTLVGGANDRAYQSGIALAHLEAQTDEALARIVAEIRIAELETITPDPTAGVGAGALQYTQAVGFTAGQVVSTPLRVLAFAYEAGELDDGIDNNGNGLVDEGRVLLTEDLGGPDERQRVLTRWVSELLEGEIQNGLDDNGNGLVDEAGFWVERDADSPGTFLLRLSLHRVDSQGRLITRTAQTSTRIRN